MDPRRKLGPIQREALRRARQEAQRFMPDAEFAERYQQCVDSAKAYFAEHGEHLHTFNAHLREHETSNWTIVPMVMLDWPPPQGKKEMTLMGLGLKLCEEYPGHALLLIEHISEAWVANYELDDVAGPNNLKAGKPTPSQRPDKLEILTISLTTIDCRQSFTNPVIIRDDAGKFKEWGNPKLEDIYDPTAELEHMPTDSGDLLPYAIMRGYQMGMADKVRRRQS